MLAVTACGQVTEISTVLKPKRQHIGQAGNRTNKFFVDRKIIAKNNPKTKKPTISETGIPGYPKW